jgi:hypothetical protein
MKKKLTSISLIPVLITICSLLVPLACKKSGPSAGDSKLSFSYNGTQYSSGPGEWECTATSINIFRPDIFNGKIHFLNPHCAYLEPTGTDITSSTDCQLTSWGPPIDSVAVYLYKSGKRIISKKNCSDVTSTDIITGRTSTHTVCDIYGSFDLVLINKENKLITITDGVFELYK